MTKGKETGTVGMMTAQGMIGPTDSDLQRGAGSLLNHESHNKEIYKVVSDEYKQQQSRINWGTNNTETGSIPATIVEVGETGRQLPAFIEYTHMVNGI